MPEEEPKPGWLRFLDEYRSYMQIILIGAAVVSLFVREWGSFDSRQMNRTAAVEIALAVLVTQMEVFNRLVNTVQITSVQFLMAVVPAVGLSLLWELGKLVARHAAVSAGTASAR